MINIRRYCGLNTAQPPIERSGSNSGAESPSVDSPIEDDAAGDNDTSEGDDGCVDEG
jgi:hypothetical protein